MAPPILHPHSAENPFAHCRLPLTKRTFHRFVWLGDCSATLQLVTAVPAVNIPRDTICAGDQYLDRASKICKSCAIKFPNSATCTHDKAVTCSFRRISNGQCVARTSCSGAKYVSRIDGMPSCSLLLLAMLSVSAITGASLACNKGVPTNGLCLAVPCTGATYSASSGRSCTRCPDKLAKTCTAEGSVTCTYGLPDNTGKCAPVTCFGATYLASDANTNDGKACCGDVNTATCTSPTAPVTCKPTFGINITADHCVALRSLAKFTTQILIGVVPNSVGFKVTAAQWGATPVESYETCAYYAKTSGVSVVTWWASSTSSFWIQNSGANGFKIGSGSIWSFNQLRTCSAAKATYPGNLFTIGDVYTCAESTVFL
ncbi:BQ2448_5764 [Microbotryum intermedium]|uniref:BQ2448_5764 protein n=1 Tax=Microbotryum intermedium TaxID=269621 RepID=A0A238F7F7_9BASI|nr:BQ2448_5764 [Microbotryum intermedium]